MGAIAPIIGAVASLAGSFIGGKPKSPQYTAQKPEPVPSKDDATASRNLRQQNRLRKGHAANRLVAEEDDAALVAQARTKSGYGLSAT